MTAWPLALKLSGPSTDVRLITELRASMQDPNRVREWGTTGRVHGSLSQPTEGAAPCVAALRIIGTGL